MNTYCTRTPDLGNWDLPLKPCCSVLLKVNFKSNQKFHRPFSPLRRWSSRSCPTTCWARSGSCRTWTRTACSTPTSSASPCTSWTSSSMDTIYRQTSPRIWCRPPSADSKQLRVWWDLVLGRFCYNWFNTSWCPKFFRGQGAFGVQYFSPLHDIALKRPETGS